MQTVAERKMAAGRAVAVADFSAGRFHPPVAGDCRPWACGYRLAIQELAETFGRDRVRAAMPKAVAA